MGHSLKIVLIVVLGCGISFGAYCQHDKLAVYVTVSSKKKCQHSAQTLDRKKVCIAPQPVLIREDFSYITEMRLDLSNQSYFNLVFTEAGATKLRNLALAFPSAQIVLVLDDLVIGYLKDLELLKGTVLKITADYQSTNNVGFVHEKLKNILPVRK